MHVWHMGVFKIFWNKAVFGCRKTFSGKYIFSGNANFRKRKIFPYVWLHFKKFSEKYFLMFGKEEGKDKPKKYIINDRDLRSRYRRCDLAIDASRDRDLGRRRDHDQLRDLATARSREGEIAIDASRDHAVDRDLGRRRDRTQMRDLATARDRAVAREIAIFVRSRRRSRSSRRSSDWLFGFFSSRVRALSLSLPLSLSLSLSLSLFGNALKWKWGEKIISGSKVKILVNRKSFSGKYHFPWQPNMRVWGKMISWIIFTQNKRTLSYTHFMNVLLLNSPTFSNIERSWSYNILISTALILAVKNYINLSSLI